MSQYKGNPDFEHGQNERIGVLVCNVGTPEAPTTSAVRSYLREFLSDPRIVELPRALWLPILHGFILATRPRRSAKAYAEIWTTEGSPLMTLSKCLETALRERLRNRHSDQVVVELGMRYGRPSIASAIDRLLKANVRRILVLPLFPQYAAATTASAYDAVYAHCRTLRWVPELRLIGSYHANEHYINALSETVRAFWSEHGRGQRLLISFHGIPQNYFLAGDPYHCQCHATARLLAGNLGLQNDDWALSFQSRLGPRRWLEPYTDNILINWAREEYKKVDVICPGFSVDCLETLEEIAVRGSKTFQEAGGDELRYIPALNDNPSHISALEYLVEQHLSGWLGISASGAKDKSERLESAKRARAAGAPR